MLWIKLPWLWWLRLGQEEESSERDFEEVAENGSVQDLLFLIRYCWTRMLTLGQCCWTSLSGQKEHCLMSALTAD